MPKINLNEISHSFITELKSRSANDQNNNLLTSTNSEYSNDNSNSASFISYLTTEFELMSGSSLVSIFFLLTAIIIVLSVLAICIFIGSNKKRKNFENNNNSHNHNSDRERSRPFGALHRRSDRNILVSTATTTPNNVNSSIVGTSSNREVQRIESSRTTPINSSKASPTSVRKSNAINTISSDKEKDPFLN